MDSPLYIAPSLLSCNFAYIAAEIERVTAGGADVLHLDVMDGHFVPNITFGPGIVRAIRKVSTIPLDTHLMIDRPERYIDQFIDAGSDWLSFHIEATDQPDKIVKRIKSKGCKAAIAIKPDTPIDVIAPFLPQLDMVLVMSVEPGFGGQAFMPKVLEKVRALRQLPECPQWIEIDGGINEQTALQAVAAGVNMLVAGSYIFKADDPATRIAKLRSS